MENVLFLSKISAVLTVLYAGLNIHQLTSSYQYLLGKAEEFRGAIADEGGAPRLVRLNILFYFAIPFGYLALLSYTTLQVKFLVLLSVKFALTASLDLWVEKSLLTGQEYSKTQHYCSRADNLVNIAAAVSVIYFLLLGVR
jgi:hypothetical protein